MPAPPGPQAHADTMTEPPDNVRARSRRWPPELLGGKVARKKKNTQGTHHHRASPAGKAGVLGHGHLGKFLPSSPPGRSRNMARGCAEGTAPCGEPPHAAPGPQPSPVTA